MHLPPSACGTLEDIDVILLCDHFNSPLSAVLSRLKQIRADIRVIVVGSDSSDEAAYRAVAMGAKGYVTGATAALTLTRAIEQVYGGMLWVSRRVLSLFIDRSSSFPMSHGTRPAVFTNRERQVLEMLVAGKSNREIAGPLGIEERTVKAHIGKLMRKVGARNRICLSMHAINHSLISAL